MGQGTRRRKGTRNPTAPILEYPGAGAAVIEPAALYAKSRPVPERCVLCFFAEILEKQRRSGELTPLTKLYGEGDPIVVSRHGSGHDAVTVAWPGLGAPFAAATLEELIGLGVRRVIVVGGAGVLDGSIPPGELLIPTAALRDEGTSYHYQRRGRWSRPHPDAVRAIKAICQRRGRSFSTVRAWTTDGVFRETPGMVRRRRGEGCLAVEMEAAALFAVARFRKVILGHLLYAGDDVSGESWDQRDWTNLSSLRAELFELALAACRLL